MKELTEGGTNGRVRYDAGDAEITIEWYERDLSGGDERRIFRRREGAKEGEVYSFNSTELRAIHVPMQRLPPAGGVPLNVVCMEARPRRAAAEQADAQRFQQMANNPLRANPRNVLFAVHEQRALPPEQLWEIPPADENLILNHCCP